MKDGQRYITGNEIGGWHQFGHFHHEPVRTRLYEVVDGRSRLKGIAKSRVQVALYLFRNSPEHIKDRIADARGRLETELLMLDKDLEELAAWEVKQ